MNQETTTIIKLMITTSRTHEIKVDGEYTAETHNRFIDALESAKDINDAVSILADEGAKVIAFDPEGKFFDSFPEVLTVRTPI